MLLSHDDIVALVEPREESSTLTAEELDVLSTFLHTVIKDAFALTDAEFDAVRPDVIRGIKDTFRIVKNARGSWHWKRAASCSSKSLSLEIWSKLPLLAEVS